MKSIRFFAKMPLMPKGISWLAMGSLCIGIGVAMIIGLWVLNEFSFDRFHQDGKYIYRVYVEQKSKNGTGLPAFRQIGDNINMPVVKKVCRISDVSLEYKIDHQLFTHEATLLAENNFFTFFFISPDCGGCVHLS